MSATKSKSTQSGSSSRSSSRSGSGKRGSSRSAKSSAGRSSTAKKSALSTASRSKSTAKKGSASAKGKNTRKNKTQPKPMRREIGALVCFLLAIFASLGYFHIEAVFITFYCDLLKGLFGYGFWFVPPALLIASIVLMFHKGRPVGRRVVSALLLPFLLGGLIHAAKLSGQYVLGEIIPLWKSGLLLESGGALSGWFAVLFCTVFSKIGAVILYVLALFFCFMLITRITPADIIDAIHNWILSARNYVENRPAYQEEDYYDEADDYEPDAPARPVGRRGAAGHRENARPVSRSQKRSAIDIPLDSVDTASSAAQRSVDEPLFDSRPGVRPPHELLAEEESGKVQEKTAPAVDLPEEDPLAGLDLQFPDMDFTSAKPAQPSGAAEAGEAAVQTQTSAAGKDGTELFGMVNASSEPEHAAPETPVDAIPEVPAEVIPEVPADVIPEVATKVVPAPPVRMDVPAPGVVHRAEPASQPAPASPQMQKSEAAVAAAKARMGGEEPAYQYPPVYLLDKSGAVSNSAAADELQKTRELLDDTIQSFGIDARIINVTRGPSVTRYELELMRGVKLNKLTNLAGDIALSLGASSVRIAPITGRSSVVGVEVPNQLVTPVPIREVIDSREFRTHVSKVAFAVGKDISGKNVVGNIAKLPHMLIAGTTGSGKSVCTNSLIISLLYKASPEDVRLIMVDPKMVELGIYNGIPHLLIPVVTDPKKAAGALQWAVNEMMKRYRLFSEVGVRDLASYNAHVLQEGGEKLPQVVVVIDELADLMLVAAKEVEESICRVAQMGRAAGMHLIIATQRPSSDVITGLMKANIPSRIAFAVASSLESRIILDTTGAEKLVGKGDMLYAPLGIGKPMRVQGCMITDEEVAKVVEFVKQNSTENYDSSVMKEVESNAEATGTKSGKGSSGSSSGGNNASVEGSADEADELLPAAIEIVVETGMASVSMLQRRLKLGYSRAARLVDQMEERGIVGQFEGSKPRQVLISKEEWNQRKNAEAGGGQAAIQADEYAAALAMSEAADAAAQSMSDYKDEGDAPF